MKNYRNIITSYYPSLIAVLSFNPVFSIISIILNIRLLQKNKKCIYLINIIFTLILIILFQAPIFLFVAKTTNVGLFNAVNEIKMLKKAVEIYSKDNSLIPDNISQLNDYLNAESLNYISKKYKIVKKRNWFKIKSIDCKNLFYKTKFFRIKSLYYDSRNNKIQAILKNGNLVEEPSIVKIVKPDILQEEIKLISFWLIKI